MSTALVPTVGKKYFITFYDERLAKYRNAEQLDFAFRWIRQLADMYAIVNPHLSELHMGWPSPDQFIPWKEGVDTYALYAMLLNIVGESGFAFRALKRLKVVQHGPHSTTVIQLDSLDRVITISG